MKKSQIHVVLINTIRVINAKGGAEKVFCDMANALTEKGYKVTALFFDKNKGNPGFYVTDSVNFINCYKLSYIYLMKKLAINFISLFMNNKKRRYFRHKFKLNRYKKGFADSLKSLEDVDIYISYGPENTYILRNILKVRSPIITMFHLNPSYFTDKCKFNIYKPALSTSVLQVLMPEFVNELRSYFPEVQIVHIPNVAPNYHNKKASLQCKKIISVGRLTPQKRHILLIKAFNLIKKDFPDWICELWGETNVDTKYREQVDYLIESLKLNDQIKLCGKTDNVSDKLEKASIFAFPSEFEGFGIALAEAFAMGLPAVGCKDCPAVNSLIRNLENGLLTEPTPEDFSKGLVYLIKNSDERIRMGNQARKDMQEYSAEKVWSSWDHLIKEVLTEKNPLN